MQLVQVLHGTSRISLCDHAGVLDHPYFLSQIHLLRLQNISPVQSMVVVSVSNALHNAVFRRKLQCHAMSQ